MNKKSAIKRILSFVLCMVMLITLVPAFSIPVFAESTGTSVDIVESVSIDKTLMSEGETVTITIKVAEGYTAKWIYFYKPITNNTVTVCLELVSENTYTGTFTVEDETESGTWKVQQLTLFDTNGEYIYLFNSNNYTGTNYSTFDFSVLDFEVVGTNADVTSPIIESFSVDKSIVSIGETIRFTAKISDENLPPDIEFHYITSDGRGFGFVLYKSDDIGTYIGDILITEDMEVGLLVAEDIYACDTNGLSTTLHNGNLTSYLPSADLSSLSFEIVEVLGNTETTEGDGPFVVVFKDGFGNTLSTQRVDKWGSAVEPDAPTNEMNLFNGWDSGFSNIISNKVITATWVPNPDAVYDREIHVGDTFSVELYSTLNQDFLVTCNGEIDFTSRVVESGIVFTDQLYYSKKIEVKVNAAGGYLFRVIGTSSYDVLTYKVKVTDHEWETKWTIDKEATCTEDGFKSRHCTLCDETMDLITISATGHQIENVPEVLPTCTSDGCEAGTRCVACGVVFSGLGVYPAAHTFDNEICTVCGVHEGLWVAKGEDDNWYSYENGVKVNYTGFADNENGTWYVENGQVTFEKNDIIKDTREGEGDWKYVKGSKFTVTDTVAKNSNGWWRVEDGIVNFDATGVFKNELGWWYCKDGKVQFNYTGIQKNDLGWWRIVGGKVDFSATGVYQNELGWWYCENGKVNFGYTGIKNNAYGWWRIENGKVNFSATGVYQNELGWWYCKDGKVDFNFTGIASNSYGKWYCKNGKVDFSKNGKVTCAGTTYTIKGGKVV